MKVAFERTERRSSTARSARRAGCIVCIGGGLLTNLILQSHLHSTDRGFLGGVIPGLGPKRVRRWRAAVPNNSSGDGGGGGGGGGGHRKSAAAATPEDSADRVGEEELALEQTMRESETDRLGTAAANASGVGAAAGPAGGDGAGGRSISTSGYDVTLVSQTSDDRAWMVVHLAKRWGGPISIAIFCVEPEERYMQAERRRLAGIARQPGRAQRSSALSRALLPGAQSPCARSGPAYSPPRLSFAGSSVAEVHGKASAGYPVNFLRNTAIARVQTSHFLLTDIDLWPSTDSYNEVLRQGARPGHPLPTPDAPSTATAAARFLSDRRRLSEAAKARHGPPCLRVQRGAHRLRLLRLARRPRQGALAGAAATNGPTSSPLTAGAASAGLAGHLRRPPRLRVGGAGPKAHLAAALLHLQGALGGTRPTRAPTSDCFRVPPPSQAHTDTHLSTDYPRWWRATWPSLIPCFKSLRYEPYLVCYTCARASRASRRLLIAAGPITAPFRRWCRG